MFSAGKSNTQNGGAVSVVAGAATQGSPYAGGGAVLMASGVSTGIGGPVSLVAGVSNTESSTAPVTAVGGKTLAASKTAGE